jgi:hypothetical protein
VSPRVNKRVAVIVASLAALMALAMSASAALASEPIESFTTTSSTTHVGGHPDLSTSFTLANPGAPESARNVIFNAPEGLFGNPNAITQCASADFALAQCPPDTQAGLITVYANSEGNPDKLLGTAPIFSMIPGEEQTALFAFITPGLGIPINIPVAVRTGSDYGLRFTVSEITQATPLAGANLTFWGFPAEEAHDSERFAKGSPGHPAGCLGEADTGCIEKSLKSTLPEQPLTDNPTICTGQPLVTSLEVQTYQDPTHPTVKEGSYPATTDCDKEVFKPVLFAGSTTGQTDSPSGLDVELQSPQFLSRAASPSQIRSATVTLPEGFTINPDAADGQGACTDAQANFHTESGPNCPDSSKIGTFALHTVALDGPLNGSVYIGQPKPGAQYRLFMAADGFGIHAKLEGQVTPDPTTGRLTVRFTDLPQVPFDSFQLHLFASDRGLMATPTNCGLHPVSAQFFPWNGFLADQTSTQFFSLTSGPLGAQCPGPIRPFHPTLEAGTTNPLAGAFSDFHLRLERQDGEQFLGDLGFTLPPGFTGDIRGIPYCSEAAIAAAAGKSGRAEQASPSCPVASQVGTTNVAAGPGTHPFHALGQMYFAGPFQGAPLSLVAITPALAGPYDYGTIVVRVALHIDPLTAQVHAVSDRMPQIIGGVPIRMRSIQVNIDRPNFTINPTNCSAMAVGSQGTGDQGTTTNFSSYFNAVNCSTLPFKPKMAITQLGGKKQTKRSQDPSLRFDLWTRPGDANIKSLAVTLPKAFEIDQRHLGNLCSKAQLQAERCKGRAPIGTATVSTPLLDQPLSGPAYAVSGYGKLPHLVFILAGQVEVMPQAESASVKGGHLRTEVPVIPDVPVGHFALTLLGGKQGYLENTQSLCGKPTVSEITYQGQNGKSLAQKVKTKSACKGNSTTKTGRK